MKKIIYSVLPWFLVALFVGLFDKLYTQKYVHDIGPWLHVLWHISAAYALKNFNEVLINV